MKSKLLLIACKKYIKDDKNGILLLILQLDKDYKNKFEKFYDTKNFEVYCFCPILEIEDDKYILENNKIPINDTEYFFVGGFDLDRREGLIKLYKIIYDDKIANIEIEYIQDIILEKRIEKSINDFKLVNQVNKEKKDFEIFKGFKGPISCIIQSTKGILITCYDGNVYLFSAPNIKLLLQNEKNYNNLLA